MGLIIPLCLILLCLGSIAPFAAAGGGSLKFSVYLADKPADPNPRFSVQSPVADLRVAAVQPLRPGRPLALIVDPASFSSQDLRRRLQEIADAIDRARAGGDETPVQLAILALDGILVRPMAGGRSVREWLLGEITPYLTAAGTDQGAGRLADLAISLLEQAQTSQGPVDCLLLAKDRPMTGEGSSYLSAGLQRRLLQACARQGSVLHGQLQGSGILGDLCRVNGGYLFDGAESGGSVVAQVLGSREMGFLLTLDRADAPQFTGPLPMTVQAMDRTGALLKARAPQAFWQSPDHSAAPDYAAMRRAIDLSQQAAGILSQQDPSRALQLARMAIEADPWNAGIWTIAGQAACELSDLEQASLYLARAVQERPPPEAAVLLYAAVLQKQGRTSAALDRIQIGIEAGMPQSLAVRFQEARLLAASGRGEEARGLYAALARESGAPAQVQAEYAALLRKLGDLGGARTALEAALSLDPINVAALLEASDAALSRGEYDAAREYAHRAAEAEPGNPEAYKQSARIEDKQGNYPAAADQMEAALALEPGRPDLLGLLADIQEHAGRRADSLETLRRVTDLDPSNPSAYRKLSGALLRSGAVSEAAAVLEEGAARAGENAGQLLLEAGALRERRQEHGQAILDYRALLRALPPDRAAAEEARISPHIAYLAGSIAAATEAKGSAPVLPRTAGPQDRLRAEDSTILIPGGLDLLARTLGIDVDVLQSPDALERMFAYILEVVPPGSGKAADSPLIRTVVLYLRNYDALVRHLQKQRLIPPDCDVRRGCELVFALAGSREEDERTRLLLRFFGIDYELAPAVGGRPGVRLSVNQGQASQERQDLLRNMGIQLLDPGLREIRFSLKDAYLPLLFREEDLVQRILGGKTDTNRTLLENLVREPACMSVYAALAACSAAARNALIKQLDAADLLRSAELISALGAHLDYRGDQLYLPGSKKAWEAFLGVPYADAPDFLRALLGRDEGKALRMYVALSSAPKPVQDYFGASGSRLQELYLLAPPTNVRSARPIATEMWRTDIGRLLRQLSVDDRGPLLQIGSRFSRFLPVARPGDVGSAFAQETSSTHLTPVELGELLSRGFSSGPIPSVAVIEVLDFLRYLQSARPHQLTAESLAAIMENPAAAPVFLDLVWDLDMDPGLTVQYLRYCGRVARERERGWNVNRTRASQALFFLLSSLRRQGQLSADEGRALLGKALSILDVPDESSFALGLAGFVANEVQGRIGRGADGTANASADPLLAALAGKTTVYEFAVDGRSLKYEAQARASQRILQTIHHQAFVPLNEILGAYRLLGELLHEGPAQVPLLRSLSESLERMAAAQFPPESARELRARTPHSDIAPLREELDSLIKRAAPGTDTARLTRDAAAALDAELSVTLLTYCYAVSGTPETDALAFDPLFVRKHDFYGGGLGPSDGWARTFLKKDQELGSQLAGSLSGLSFQLCSLEASPAAQGFGKREGRDLVPTVLSGMRAVPPLLISDRAQEYVALSARLGREIIARAALDPSVGRWCGEFLAQSLPPVRRDLVMEAIDQARTTSSMQLLSPSELFFLGQAYLQDVLKSDPGSPEAGSGSARGPETDGDSMGGSEASSHRSPARFFSPALVQLASLVSQQDAGAREQFHEELNQYGILVARRLGLSGLSLSSSDSYELLASTAHPGMLYERICDLKIRLAEINYALGLPAVLEQLQGELAIRDILPRSNAVYTNTWKLALDQIQRLSAAHALAWAEELINEGILTPSDSHEKSQ